MKRRMLIVVPHDTVLRAEGHRERLLGIVALLVDFELAWLIPSTLREREALADVPVFTFDEPALGRLKIPYIVDWSPSFQRACRSAIDSFEPDIVLCDLPWGARWIAASSALPVAYLSHGVERDFTDTTLLHLHLRFFPLTAIARTLIGSIERQACQSAALTITMSSTDLHRYRELYGTVPTLALEQPMVLRPLNVERSTARARFQIVDDELVCIFHGSWHHAPNRIAVDAIRRSIAPAFRQQRVRFLIAGTGMERFHDGNVTGVGFLEDLDTLLAAADLAVLPILHGAGVRMKTFDYVRAEIPIVATAKAIEGVGFLDSVHAAVSADDLVSFTNRLTEMLAHQERWSTLSSNALAHTRLLHDPQRLRDTLGDALDRCLSTEAPIGEGAHLSGR